MIIKNFFTYIKEDISFSDLKVGNVIKFDRNNDISIAIIIQIIRVYKKSTSIYSREEKYFYQNSILIRYIKSSFYPLNYTSIINQDMKYSIIKKWDNMKEYKDSFKKYSDIDPYGEEIWENNNNDIIHDDFIDLLDFINKKERTELERIMISYTLDSNMEKNILIKMYLTKILNNNKVIIFFDDKHILFNNIIIISSFPYMLFINKEKETTIKIPTLDICNNPNKIFKIKIKKRIYNENDPYGEENWD